MKLNRNYKIIIAADGSAASGKTTGARLISKKFGLKFMSSGLLYRFAAYLILKNNPKNKIIITLFKSNNLISNIFYIIFVRSWKIHFV